MGKKSCVLAAVLAVLAVLALPALGEETGALEWAELNGFAQGCLARARESRLLNDPRAEDALTEDGYALVYDFATLYMSEPSLDENSLLMGVLILDMDQEGPRGVAPAMPAAEALSLFRNDNPMLVGGRSGAVLYAEDSPEGCRWGYVQRDGQWIGLIQYAVHERLADGVTDAGLLLTMERGGVAAIRIYGLQRRITEADVEATRLFVEEEGEAEDYQRLPDGLWGEDVTRFGEEDLVFDGVSLAGLTPEKASAAFGEPEADETVTDPESGTLRTLSFGRFELVFDGADQLMLLSCEDGAREGPRAVRVGDALTAVLGRFAAETSAGGVLYGTPGQAPYGIIEFAEDSSAALRYAAPAADGRTAVLLMYFEELELTEFYLFYETE